MNGQKHVCPLCKSEKIGRQMRNEFILFTCLTCKCEWREYFDDKFKIEMETVK